jgi:putative hydrolases of HD superfamily
MRKIADLLFEARKLKHIPRSGYHFLEAGRETVAEHSFMTTFIAFVLSRMHQDIDRDKLIRMCLVHDLPETRIGDLNYVQKQYVVADEHRAMEDALSGLPFQTDIMDLIEEFNEGKTLEAKLAKDADQLAFILDLKALADLGYNPPSKWLAHVSKRLITDIGKKLSAAILNTNSDAWWLEDYSDKFVDRSLKKK